MLSRSTLYILDFYEQVLTLIFGVILFLFKMEPEVYKSILIVNIIFSMGVCLGIGIMNNLILLCKLKINFKNRTTSIRVKSD
ncbi:MAG: hypothetical protein ABIN39_05680 [candidate division WOR-3 bacterium]